MSVRTWLTASLFSFSTLSMAAPKAGAAPVQEGENTLSTEEVIDISSTKADQSTQYVTEEGITYTLTGNSIQWSGSIGRVSHELMPKIYTVECKSGYFCGSQKIANHLQFAQTRRDITIRRILSEEAILRNMTLQGMDLNNYQDFIARHQEELSQYGFIRVNGELKQQDPCDRVADSIDKKEKVNAPVKQQTTKKPAKPFFFKAHTH